MTNNLQALNLVNIHNKKFNSFIESDEIKFSKESFKNIAIDSWIEIDSRDIKANCIVDNSINANCLLKAYSNYLYADIELNKKRKMYKKSSNKSTFTINIKMDREVLQNSCIALTILPADVIILRAGKIFAYANLYFNGSFLLEIKEIL